MADRHETEDALKRLLNMFGEDWTAFNNLVVNFPVPREPQLPAPNRAKFRHDFLLEEANEFKDSCAEGDLDGAVDALIDLIYVAVGGLGEMGVLVQPTWAEVQNANMRKRRGSVDKPRSDGTGYDAVKPEGWTGPNHLPYLSITSDDVQALMAMKLGDQDVRVTLGDGNVWGVMKAESQPRGSVQQLELSLDGSKVKEMFDEGIKRIEAAASKVGVHHLEDRKPRLLILGHGRHGKDTVSEMLRERYDFQFTSSSWFCAERVIMPAARSNIHMPVYPTVQECYDDRHNFREFWYETIRDFNRPDATALGRAIWAENDVYCGLRSKAEFNALRNVGAYDYAIWVDASDRLPPEGAGSISVEPWMADFVLDNNGSLEDLELNLKQLMEYIL